MGITALIGSSLVGAGGAIYAANKQASTAKSYASMQEAQAQKLNPFINEGQVGIDALNKNLNYLTTPYAPTMAQLQQTPGYQFTLGQGLKATQNAAAARGLGVSGAALKGAAGYATGLANSTYATNAGIYQTNQAQIGNLLTGMVNSGANAAAGQGSLINNAAQTGMAGATAGASGIIGAANALTGMGQGIYQNGLIQQMMAQNGTSASDIAAMHNLFKF